MCCSASGYNRNEINGNCPKCGEDTVDGDAYYCCSYSPLECDECGTRYCDQSC